jgi:hypothetical protein
MLTSLLFAVAAFQASGADWEYFFTNGGNVKFFFDRENVVHLPNGHVRAWEKEEWRVPDPNLGGEIGFLWLVELDCKQSKFVFRDIRPIRGNGKSLPFVAKMIPLYVGEWRFLGPNDLDEVRYSKWCADSSR